MWCELASAAGPAHSTTQRAHCEEKLAAGLAGQEAVISALGFPKTGQQVDGFSRSIRPLLTAMRAAGVARLVVTSAWFTLQASRADPFYQVRITGRQTRPMDILV